MKRRLRDVIDSIDYDELLRMKADIDSGALHLKSFVDKQIKARELEHQLQCSVCTNLIDKDSVSTFTLLFGPSDFKKKATFCGKDCLLYFISKTDEMKLGRIPKTFPDTKE